MMSTIILDLIILNNNMVTGKIIKVAKKQLLYGYRHIVFFNIIILLLFHVDCFSQTEPFYGFREVCCASCEFYPAETLEAGVYVSSWALTFPHLHRHTITWIAPPASFLLRGVFRRYYILNASHHRQRALPRLILDGSRILDQTEFYDAQSACVCLYRVFVVAQLYGC